MLYAAYGSNLNLEQMAYRCPHSKPVGVAYLHRWKLMFKYHADIVGTYSNEDIVPVLLWDIAKEDWEKLDRYEGYPKYYVKRIVKVEYENTIVDAIAYIMADTNRRNFYDFPDRDYYNIIVEGYYENKLPLKYLYEAIKDTSETIAFNYLTGEDVYLH